MRSIVDIIVFCAVGLLTFHATESILWALFSQAVAGAYSVFVFWTGLRKGEGE